MALSALKDREALHADLLTGSIDVEVDRTTVPPIDLFGFAQRRNPKRGFLFVSRILGRHIPVAPSVMQSSYVALARQCVLTGNKPILVIGMAETAVGLGAGVHRELARRNPDRRVVYLTTTRHRLDALLLCSFEEEHSHATTHLIHQPADPAIAEAVREARSLILVDDEMSTGKTFINLMTALRSAGITAADVTLVTLTDWSDGKAVKALGRGCRSVSLLSGRYSWTPDVNAPAIEMPHVGVTRSDVARINPAMDWGRLGVLDHCDTLSPRTRCRDGERILVLGTGEHVWRPFLLAESLEKAGAKVRYSSVTRSPIAVGHAISSALAFSDNYGLGIANFAYNVDPKLYDRIILCVETTADTIDPALIDAICPEILSEIDGAVS